MTELAALNVKINGDSADLQSDLAKASKQLSSFDAQANKANKGTKGFSGSLAKLGNVSGSTRAKIQNTSFQLQDIAVQLSMGTRASTVFAQQLPQLASGFGVIGAVVGVLAGVGIPALAFAFSAMGGETLTLEDKVEKLKDALDAYSEASEKATMTTSELKEKFGEGAAGLKTTYELLQQIADEKAQEAIDGVAQSLADLFGVAGAGERRAAVADFFDVNIAFAFSREAKAAAKSAQELTGQFKNAQAALQASEGDLEGQAEATLRLLNITRQLASENGEITKEERDLIELLANRLATMQEHLITQRQVNSELNSGSSAVDDTKSTMEDLVGQAAAFAKSLTEITGSQEIARKRAEQYLRAVTQLEVKIGEAAVDALILGGVDIVAGVDAAALAAAKLAANLNISLAEALKLQALGQDPLDPFGGAGRFIPSDRGYPDEPDVGGGGGADPLISELESVQNALMTQEEKQIESFQRQQATLQQALEQRLLTQQEYNALMEQAQSQHADKMTAIDAYRYGTDLQKADQFLGDMASAFQSGNEDMLRISKAFGAAQALVSAFTGAAEALKLPFPANLAAFAKVLATGLGAVQSIKGVTPGGGGASAAGAVASAAAAPAPAPLNVRLSGMSADEFISGASLESLFDRLQDEAGDRGLRVSFA
jgi:chromosome segregation ATPase